MHGVYSKSSRAQQQQMSSRAQQKHIPAKLQDITSQKQKSERELPSYVTKTSTTLTHSRLTMPDRSYLHPAVVLAAPAGRPAVEGTAAAGTAVGDSPAVGTAEGILAAAFPAAGSLAEGNLREQSRRDTPDQSVEMAIVVVRIYVISYFACAYPEEDSCSSCSGLSGSTQRVKGQ